MDELKELRELVKELDKEDLSKDKTVNILQDIMLLILREYAFYINNYEIIPLWLEAYYYNKQKFEDGNVHGSYNDYAKDKQTDRFGQLYIHKSDWGIDICLSLGNYCLSFLIKCAVVKEDDNYIFCSQNILAMNFCNKYCNNENCKTIKDCIYNNSTKEDSQYITLKKRTNPYEGNCLKTVRIGLTRDSTYGKELLATFVFDEKYISKYRWEKDFAKQWTFSVNSLIEEKGNESAAYKLACERNGSKIEDEYFNSAIDYYKE